MYKHFSLLALVAALVLAACSSDDDLDAAATSDSDATSAYMAVNIYMSSDAATRSSSSTVSSDGYATGTSEEYAIDLTKSIFLFYASDGSYLTSALPTETGNVSSTTSSNEDYVEYTTSAMLVLSPTTLTPANMVGILNDAKYESYKGMSLDELQEALFTSSNDDGTNLLMSNAVKYTTSDGFSFATSISSTDIKDSENDATSNPVDMYVERAKARVAIGVTENNFTSTESGTYTYTLQETDDDGNSTDRTFTYYYVDATNGLSYTDATVDITINGWAVNAYNQTGYVIKNYSNGGTELSSDINSSDAPGGAWGTDWYSSFRIFWAVDGNYAAEASTDDDWGLKYWTWTDVTTQTTPCSTDAAYYYEQTLDPNATTGYDDGETAYAPTLLVAATVGVNADGATEADGAGNDIFLSYGEVLYSESAVYAKILSLLKEAGYTGDATISSITWTTKEASKGTVVISSITMSDESTDVSSYITAINNSDFISNGSESEDATAYYLRKYDGGASYYQVPIQTYITSSSSPYGLVRNTAYSITINSVTGIGAGVPNPDEKLTDIPEEDETGHLAAKINILAWRLSSQKVDL